MKHPTIIRLLCTLLAICLLGGALVACSKESEIPDGYQYATCKGEYFLLFVPTQWTVNTESGVSGGSYALLEGTAVSMTEVPFDKPSAEGEADTVASLEDFFNAHMAEIATLKGYAAEKSLDTTLGSYKAKDVTYSASIGEDVYRYRQVLTKVAGRFYLFTYSSKADSFNQWLDTVDEILENVVFTAYPFEGSEDEKKIPDVETPAGMKLVTTNDLAYRFFAPETWVIGDAEAASLVYASESDRSNVTVTSYAAPDGYSVANYWEDTEKYYKDALKDYTLVGDPTESEMGGKKATVYEYTYSLGGVTYKCRQSICVFGYMIVVMTYTALPENYDAHMAEVEKMQAELTFRR